MQAGGSSPRPVRHHCDADETLKRFLRILSVTMITAGIVILADAGITLAWKEPLSAAYASFRQRAADHQLDTLRSEFLASPEVAEIDRPTGRGGSGEQRLAEQRAARLADVFERQRLEDGEAFGRLEIPSLGVDYVVIEGTDTGSLQRGPGHYPTTALPGQGETIAIAGHRTTYGAPFSQINAIEPGDEIIIEMPYGTFAYEVTKSEIVEPTDVGIVDDVGSERLVLTACHPRYSAAQRYAVFADLTSASPVDLPAG